jgi:hypothetical protein
VRGTDKEQHFSSKASKVDLWKQTHHMQLIYFLVALKGPRESEGEEIKVV